MVAGISSMPASMLCTVHDGIDVVHRACRHSRERRDHAGTAGRGGIMPASMLRIVHAGIDVADCSCRHQRSREGHAGINGAGKDMPASMLR